MRLSFIKTACVLLVALISTSVSGQGPQTLNETFTSGAGNWTTSSGSSFTVSNGLLYCNMANQGSDKYRGDLQYNSASSADKDITFNNQVDKYLAIKFIGGRPHGAMKFEMQKNDGTGWFNSQWNGGSPDGFVQTANGNVICYFNLTKDAGYNTGEATFGIRRINVIIADATAGDFTYAVDWVATFASIEDLEAYKNTKDDGEGDIDEAEYPAEVQSVYSPFIKFREGWSLSNSGALSASEGNMNCTAMGIAGEKYRADMQYNVMDRAENDLTMDASKDKIIAIKFIGSRPAGTFKFEMKTSAGTWYNTYNGTTGTITTANNNNIYYFDLTTNSGYTATSGAIAMRRLNFIIADVVADEAPVYTVDWIATFENLDDLNTFKNINDDGDNDTDVYRATIPAADASSLTANSFPYVYSVALTDTWTTANLNQLQTALGATVPNLITAEEVVLTDDEELLLTQSFHADKISYSRTLNQTLNETDAVLETICLPYSTPVPAGTTVKVYTGSNGTDQVTFEALEGNIMAANTPYIISRTSNTAFAATDVDVIPAAATVPDPEDTYTFKGTYTSLTGADAIGKYVSNGTTFAYSIDGASIAPYRAYLEMTDSRPAPAILNIGDGGATGMDVPENGNELVIYSVDGGVVIETTVTQSVKIYSIAGQMVYNQIITPGQNAISLANGVYLIGNEKVMVR